MSWRDNPPRTYVVVLNWNGFLESKECIESLLKTTFANLHIVIVDNASTDGSGGRLRETFPELDFVQSSENGGYAAGMNQGITFALSKNAEYIILMNNDVVVAADFVDPLIETCINDPAVGIVSPKVLYKDRRDYIYCAGAKIDYLRCSGVSLSKGKRHDLYGNIEGPISVAEGCCLCVRAVVFGAIGLLDPKYFMYFEDVDFSIRVRRQYTIAFVPKSLIYHKSGAGDGWLAHTPLYQYYYTRNRLWFFSSFSILYRCYVLLFSLLVVAAKSLNLWIRLGKESENSASLKALWMGLSDGCVLLFGGLFSRPEGDFCAQSHK